MVVGRDGTYPKGSRRRVEISIVDEISSSCHEAADHVTGILLVRLSPESHRPQAVFVNEQAGLSQLLVLHG